MIPLVIFGTGTLFEKITGAGLGSMAVRRLQGAVQLEGGGETLVGRLIAYGVAVERIRERPVLGGGHGATVTYLRADETGSYTYMFTSGKVDNLYLTLMMRMGVVGLVAFLWVFARGLKLAFRLFRRTESVHRRLIGASFFAVYAAMLVYGMVDSTMIGNRLIFFHAIFLGLLAREYGEEG
jgi:O-antigen ligase